MEVPDRCRELITGCKQISKENIKDKIHFLLTILPKNCLVCPAVFIITPSFCALSKSSLKDTVFKNHYIYV